MNPRTAICTAAILLGAVLTGLAQTDERGRQEEARLKLLIEKIASGDSVESADATERLIEQVIGPLTKVIGSLDSRPMEQHVRIRAAVQRLHAALRVRLFRADLPDEDRKLFDAFAKQYSELVDQLFHENADVRRAAVERVPLEPNTGAGIAIASRVNDEAEEVATAAIEVAERLKDPVVARRLTHYTRDFTKAMRDGYFQPGQEDLARSVAILVLESMKVVAKCGQKQHGPDLAEAFRYLARSPHWLTFQKAEAARALGELGDPRVAPALLERIDDPADADVRGVGPGQRLVQTVGDAALLGLLKTFALKPDEYGFATLPDSDNFTGFYDDKTRATAQHKFRQWYEQNAPKDAAPTASAPAASAPASRPTERTAP